MQCVLPAPRAEFIQFHAAGIIAAILFRHVVPLFAQSTFKRHNDPNTFFLGHI
jgi:hypothetical protein